MGGMGPGGMMDGMGMMGQNSVMAQNGMMSPGMLTPDLPGYNCLATVCHIWVNS